MVLAEYALGSASFVYVTFPLTVCFNRIRICTSDDSAPGPKEIIRGYVTWREARNWVFGGSGPRLTTRSTAVPSSASVSFSMPWLITWPAGTDASWALEISPVRSPASVSKAAASFSVFP